MVRIELVMDVYAGMEKLQLHHELLWNSSWGVQFKKGMKSVTRATIESVSTKTISMKEHDLTILETAGRGLEQDEET